MYITYVCVYQPHCVQFCERRNRSVKINDSVTQIMCATTKRIWTTTITKNLNTKKKHTHKPLTNTKRPGWKKILNKNDGSHLTTTFIVYTQDMSRLVRPLKLSDESKEEKKEYLSLKAFSKRYRQVGWHHQCDHVDGHGMLLHSQIHVISWVFIYVFECWMRCKQNMACMKEVEKKWKKISSVHHIQLISYDCWR